MAKKRVHELAKEFGLENKVVIKLLQQAGVSVKTHSSSVYEDEARRILGRDVKPEAPKTGRRPGMKIVRKGKKADDLEAASETLDETGEEPEAPEAPEAILDEVLVAETGMEGTADEEEGIPASVDAAPEQIADDLAAVELLPEDSAESVGAPDAVEEVAEPDGPGVVETEVEVTSEASGAEEGEGETPQSRRPKRKPGSATVVRMIDRDKLLERVPSNRLGGAVGRSDAAPGGKSFGQVTELKVVTDPFGRGREMVTVTRDKKGRSSAQKRGKTTGKRERQTVRERAMFPSRLRRKKTTKRAGKATEVTLPRASKRVIKMKETMTIADLAHQLGVKAVELIRKLMSLNMMTGMNDSVDLETAQLLAADFEFTVESVAFDEGTIVEEVVSGAEADAEKLIPRPPVVTIMGHVDHGKTSLLDAIRKTKVASGEAGGITQHIGAYSVKVKGKGSITFLDTPGHAAFTEMRARGANVTDIVVLVVAADDGVMPQTVEAIQHSKAAGVPIIVAVNKIDRPDANSDRVIQELAKFELVPEAWGGETLYVETSATQKTGLDELLEAIMLQAEVIELVANEERHAVGTVIEASLDKGRGPVATVLVQHGTLRRGDAVVVGEHAGKIRAMTDHMGKSVKVAGPSAAVEIIGLDGVPDAGDRFNAVESAEAAREVAQHRVEQRKAHHAAATNKMSLEDLVRRMSGEEATDLNIVLKADVQGSVEAVRSALEKLSTDEVKVVVLLAGVGGIKESDIMLASTSDGIILGFGVRPDGKARSLAQQEGVEIRTYTVIYEMIDDVTKAMEGLLSPESKEKVVGRAEVRDTFKISKVGLVAGCRVVDGKAVRSAKVRVLRDNVEVFAGKLSSLKHFKDDVREVDAGSECGIGVEGFNDIKLNDVIEFYEIEEILRTLGSSSGKRSAGPIEAHP